MLNQPIILFWTDKEAMRAVKEQYFSGYQEVEIPRNEFLETWLNQLSAQKVWPGFDYTVESDGYHFDPADMLWHLKEAVRLT